MSQNNNNINNNTQHEAEGEEEEVDQQVFQSSTTTAHRDKENNQNNNNNNNNNSSSSIFRNLGSNLEVAGILLLNLVSVVGIVALNKRIYQLGFNFPSTLMTLHFCVTWLFVVACHKFGVFEAKQIETKQYVKLGAAQVGSVALVNLSLLVNPVTMYQLWKFGVVLVTALLEYLFFTKIYPLPVYGVLVVLVVSISLATISSLEFSGLTGVAFGLGGAIATSYYQIANKQIQNDHNVSPMQLLHYEQPFSAFWCLLLAILTEPVAALPYLEWRPELVLFILLSSICAFGVNVSCYLIVGKTSPITYSVVGHIKTVSIFAMGILFLGDTVKAWQGFWMMVAFAMIVLYGKVATAETAKTDCGVERKHKVEDDDDDNGAKQGCVDNNGGGVSVVDSSSKNQHSRSSSAASA